MDTLPQTRGSPERIGHHRGVKPGRHPEFCETLKLLAASVVQRRKVPPSSKVSKQWPRSFGLRSDAPSRASFPLLATGMKPEMARLTLARKSAAIALTLWKKEEPFDAEQLKPQAA